MTKKTAHTIVLVCSIIIIILIILQWLGVKP